MSDGDRSLWSVQFRRERQKTWTELDDLIQQAERNGLRRLRADQLARLPVLYRATLSSLAVARATVLDRGLLDHLEALVSRAYLLVYAPQRSVRQVLGPFLLAGFPAAVRSLAWHVAVSAGLLLLGAAIAAALVHADTENYYLFVDPGMAQGRDPTATTEHLRDTLFGGDDDADLLTFAMFLFTHNSGVGILTFGLGIAFGLPVVLMLLYNGMLLGAMTALFVQRGLGVEWFSWILPHGVPELSAIVFCGAAGLAVGQAIVFPGLLSRQAALVIAGRRVASVVAGSVLMLFLAGFVEGVFRQSVQDLTARYSLASLFALLMVAYFVRAGKNAP